MSDTNHIHRVLQAVRHEQPDRVPYYISCTIDAARKLAGVYGAGDLDTLLDNDLVRYSIRRPALFTEVRPGFVHEDFGVVWNRTIDKDIGIPESYPLMQRSLADFHFPDPRDPRRFADLPGFIKLHATRFRFINIGFSLFERAWSLRSMPELMVDMLEAPEWVEELLDAILAYNLELIDELLKYDIHGILFGDDWGQQQGLLFGPVQWRRFVKPRLAQMIAAVKRADKVAMIHSCGRVQQLFPDLVEIGLDVFNPFQPDVMDVYAIKRQYGDRLTFYGGMSVQGLLPHGTPQQIRGETRRLMDGIGRDGGFIIGPSHHMPGDIPVDNMVAFIEAVRAG